MFGKLLIANRGEIAVRIAGACRELGIVPVAVYSDADRGALHVRSCDEAYNIGPAPAAESYLRGEMLIAVARQSGCEAIHPGYGFLSESADFARAVTKAGLVWIGPPPEAIEMMGSKIESRKLAERLGVPTVPGYDGGDQSDARLLAEASRIGYPVLIKASAGGGGKGMRVVSDESKMAESAAAAKREAQAAFGDSSVLLEKYLASPRHIEVQVLGDNRGQLVHLGERECSIQRRHQKVVEESPSPAVTPELRERLTTAALTLAGAAGYTNAGTVEFIYEGGEFYFLEMNTRLQVEHPVTEEALGIDLVQTQIRVAFGEPLPFSQEDVEFRSHAMEARLYAEDPEHDFVPSTGKLSRFNQGNLVRIDTGFGQGDTVTPYYDPMIAKVIVAAPTREDAGAAMCEALGQIQVDGVTTNLGFLRWLFAHPEFRAGNLSTNFITEHWKPGAFVAAPTPVVVAAGAALALQAAARSGSTRLRDAWHAGPWRQGRQDMLASPIVNGLAHQVRFSAVVGQADTWDVAAHQGEATIFEGRAAIDVRRSTANLPAAVTVQFAGQPVSYILGLSECDGAESFRLEFEAQGFSVTSAPGLSTASLGRAVRVRTEGSLESPMPGKVLKVLVEHGESVDEEQPLVIIEAMKMEFVVRAPHEGKIAKIHYPEGSQVAVGDILVEMQD